MTVSGRQDSLVSVVTTRV